MTVRVVFLIFCLCSMKLWADTCEQVLYIKDLHSTGLSHESQSLGVIILGSKRVFKSEQQLGIQFPELFKQRQLQEQKALSGQSPNMRSFPILWPYVQIRQLFTNKNQLQTLFSLRYLTDEKWRQKFTLNTQERNIVLLYFFQFGQDSLLRQQRHANSLRKYYRDYFIPGSTQEGAKLQQFTLWLNDGYDFYHQRQHYAIEDKVLHQVIETQNKSLSAMIKRGIDWYYLDLTRVNQVTLSQERSHHNKVSFSLVRQCNDTIF